MADIKVPTLGESITSATVAKWFKSEGDAVAIDEPICELETDKVTVEVNAPVAGVLNKITAQEGEEVEVDAVLGAIAEGDAAAPAPAAEEKKEEAPAAPAEDVPAMPAAKKTAADKGVDLASVEGTGKDGRVTKGDVIEAAEKPAAASAPAAPVPSRENVSEGELVERVKMTKLRQTIAKRLKESQNTAAMLTTFNEVDMHNIMQLRKKYQDKFVDKYGVKLGFMSLFAKAAVAALKDIPAVNASIEGDEIVYKKFYNLGIAVGTKQGLVVPVVKDCDGRNYAEIEKEIARLGKAARDGKLGMAEMTGGTFSITNGGIYGSMMSTPIINPPQTAILGMHNIVERPHVVDGEIKVRPIMYLALSYDHRLIDGGEAVTFLVKIKEAIENPERLLLEI